MTEIIDIERDVESRVGKNNNLLSAALIQCNVTAINA